MLEPWGDEWLRTAILAELFANANRDPEKKAEPFEIEDFMPKWSDSEEEEFETGEEAVLNEPWKAWKSLFQLMADEGKRDA
jgi:hypothetical protein